MLTTIFFNVVTGIVALALSGSVALHDSRLDKVFAGTVTVSGDNVSHQYGHALAHELHVHGSRVSADPTDPMRAARSHRKYTALPHARLKLSSLAA